MATLSCHREQSTCATAIKSNLFEEENVKNNSANIQLYSPYGFLGDFQNIYGKCSISDIIVHM